MGNKKGQVDPQVKRLIEEKEALREVIREAHEARKDLEAERKRVEKAYADALPELMEALNEAMDKGVALIIEAGLTRYKSTLDTAVQEGRQAVIDVFDDLMRVLTLTSKEDMRAGSPSLQEMVKAIARGDIKLSAESIAILKEGIEPISAQSDNDTKSG